MADQLGSPPSSSLKQPPQAEAPTPTTDASPDKIRRVSDEVAEAIFQESIERFATTIRRKLAKQRAR